MVVFAMLGLRFSYFVVILNILSVKFYKYVKTTKSLKLEVKLFTN